MPAHTIEPVGRRVGLALVVGVLVSLAPVRLAAQDLEEVEERVDELEERLEAATRQYEDTVGRVHAAEHELAELQERKASLEAQAEEADEALRRRARDVFMHGQPPTAATLLTGRQDVGTALERVEFLEIVTGRSTASLEEAVAIRTQLDSVEVMVEDRRARLAVLEERLGAQRDTLDAELATQQDLAQDLRERAARQREINSAVMNGTYACIHDANSFVDSWGAPRSGGRSHKGTDVMAPMGVPVYAFTTGRVSRLTSSRLGGTNLYIWGDDGNEYFYAHLQRYAEGVHVGLPVEAGQLVAYNGDSGNARGGPPHVHFEVHPGGGGAVNPYQYMLAACR